jgi:hypothetical protein
MLATVSIAVSVAAIYLCTRVDAPPTLRTPARLATERALTARVSATFQETPFDEALATLSRASGVSITYDRAALARIGAPRRIHVSARVRGVQVTKALGVVLGAVNLGESSVFIRPNGSVAILTPAQVEGEGVWREYDVRPHVVRFGEANRDFNSDTSVKLQRDLVGLIEETVDTEGWGSAGAFGEHSLANGWLRIRQHPEQHHVIALLLDQILPRDAAMRYLHRRLMGERR